LNPADEAAIIDFHEALRRSLTTKERRILDYLLQGVAENTIARELGFTPYAVYKAIESIRGHFKRLWEG
jgi:DNA-binding CsgD family transcriptional regulator